MEATVETELGLKLLSELQSKHYMSMADVAKAYDNVDLLTLDKIIISLNPPDVVLKQWKDELYDLNELNMGIGSETILRTNGLPQGSELAPLLFNLYTSYILNLEEFSNLTSKFNLEIYVYADNWVIYTDNQQNLYSSVLEINELLKCYSLEFTIEEIDAMRFDKLEENVPNPERIKTQKEIDKFYDDEKKDTNPIKFLGFSFAIFQNKLRLISGESRFNLANCRTEEPYEVFRFYKTYILGKFRYYYETFKIWDPGKAMIYKEWLWLQTLKWMRKRLITLKISRKWFEDALDSTNAENEILKKYYVFYWKDFNELNEYEESKRGLLARLKQVVNFVYERKVRIGIYSVTNFLFSKENPNIYFRNYKPTNDKYDMVRTWRILDDLYFCIMANHRFSTYIAMRQEMFNFRTERYKRYQFL